MEQQTLRCSGSKQRTPKHPKMVADNWRNNGSWPSALSCMQYGTWRTAQNPTLDCKPGGPFSGSFPAAKCCIGWPLEVLKWLRQQGCRLDLEWCAQAAAYGGHSEVLKWCKGAGYRSLNWRVCDIFAENSYLGLLQWARANRFLWDKTTCQAVAKGGTTGHPHLAPREWMS